jgi:predicted MPP superfamily phosphohydrolase
MPEEPAAGKLRGSTMAVFHVIVLSIYGLVNFYISLRGWQALAGFPRARWIVFAAYWAFILCYPAGRIILARGRTALAAPLVKIGSFHLALMIYLVMGVVLVDLVRLINAFIPFLPRSLVSRPHQTGIVLFLAIGGVSVLVVAGGILNAMRPRTVELSLSIDKPAGVRTSLSAVVASDIHLGTIAGSARLRKLVDRINRLEPDIVLLPGDVVDESVTEAEEEAMTAVFKKLRAPLGIYSVPGNHEYYGGIERNLAYLRKWGVRVLQDEAVEVDGSFYLIGRKDPSALRRHETRLSIPEIMKAGGVDPRRPLILLDHQPLHLEEAEAAGIDLQLSGHTHAGQLFPLTLINKRIYEQNWGYLRKGKTQYYVSCGVGTWGPPVRTGSVPEIIRIRLTFGDGR